MLGWIARFSTQEMPDMEEPTRQISTRTVLLGTRPRRHVRRKTRQMVFPRLPPRLKSGIELGPFRIVRELSRGGLASVYEAEDLAGGERLAVKVLAGHLSCDPAAIERFEQEVELTSRVAHPSIISIRTRGRALGYHYYAMELQSGETAEALALSPSECVGEMRLVELAASFAAVADALARLHEAGVVHRDVKPENLLVGEDGRLILCDFGSALERGESPRALAEGLWGTVQYMAPEQLAPDSDPFDPRGDIYALGVTLHEVITGASIAPEGTVEELVRWKLSRIPPSARRLRPEVPLGLDAILREAMEPNPLLRYRSAADMARDLSRFADRRRGHRR